MKLPKEPAANINHTHQSIVIFKNREKINQRIEDLPGEEEADLPFDTDLISDFGDHTIIDY